MRWSDPLFPIESQAYVKIIQKSWIEPGKRYSPSVYSRPLNVEFFNTPDTENFLIHVAGLITPFMNWRLLHTEEEHGSKRVDAVYLDLDTGKNLRIEWELNSSNFLAHDHDPRNCDAVMFWHDDLESEEKRAILGSNPSLKFLDVSKILHHYELKKSRQM